MSWEIMSGINYLHTQSFWPLRDLQWMQSSSASCPASELTQLKGPAATGSAAPPAVAAGQTVLISCQNATVYVTGHNLGSQSP